MVARRWFRSLKICRSTFLSHTKFADRRIGNFSVRWARRGRCRIDRSIGRAALPDKAGLAGYNKCRSLPPSAPRSTIDCDLATTKRIFCHKAGWKGEKQFQRAALIRGDLISVLCLAQCCSFACWYIEPALYSTISLSLFILFTPLVVSAVNKCTIRTTYYKVLEDVRGL